MKPNSITIISGPRWSGKTSLLMALCEQCRKREQDFYALDEGYHISFHGNGSHTRVPKNIFRHIEDVRCADDAGHSRLLIVDYRHGTFAEEFRKRYPDAKVYIIECHF